jgi:hypothetical protein
VGTARHLGRSPASGAHSAPPAYDAYLASLADLGQPVAVAKAAVVKRPFEILTAASLQSMEFPPIKYAVP